MLQKRQGIWAFDPEFAHVTDVKQAGALADGTVFVDDTGVLYRHVPPAEFDHAGVEAQVLAVEYRAQQFFTHLLLLMARHWPRWVQQGGRCRLMGGVLGIKNADS